MGRGGGGGPVEQGVNEEALLHEAVNIAGIIGHHGLAAPHDRAPDAGVERGDQRLVAGDSQGEGLPK